jgi:predicted dehydrogenase/uncharacterized membrane protein
MFIKSSSIGLSLATGTSLVNVLMDVCRKKALKNNEVIGTTFWMRVIAGLVFAGAFAVRLQTSHLSLIRNSGAVFGLFGAGWNPTAKFTFYLVFDTGLVAVAILHYLSALQESDLSVCVPFLSFTPVLLIPTGYLFLREVPNTRQLLGVLLVVMGSFAMNRGAFRFGPLGPLREIFRDKGSRYTLLVAVILAITNPMDKILVLMSDSVTYAFGYGAMLCLFFAGLMLWHGESWMSAFRTNPGWILVAGAMDALVLLLQFTSHRYIDVLLTITIKRAGVILSVLAGWLIFREKQIEDRLVASAVMLGGVILIYTPLSQIEQLVTVVSLIALLTVRWRGSSLLMTEPQEKGERQTSENLAPNREEVLEMREDVATESVAPILRCAILGCGQIAQEYLDLYADIGWTRVTVCVDLEIGRAQRAVAYLQDRSTSFSEMLASTKLDAALSQDVDVVIISTPNYMHREHALAAFAAGKHVFLQKPIANTLQDGFAIVEAARQCNATAGVYMSYFDQPVVHDLRGMAQAGCFGKITQVHMRLMHPGGLVWSAQASEGNPSWRGSIAQTGGGAFIQLAVHSVRIISWMLGERVTQVKGFASNRMCPELEGEDSAVALLEFESGTFATLNMSWCASGEELSIHGSAGSAVYRDNRWLTLHTTHSYEGLALRTDGLGNTTFDCIPPALSDVQPFNQHLLFLAAVRDSTPAFVSLEDALLDLAVVEAFYEAVRTGVGVKVERVIERIQPTMA